MFARIIDDVETALPPDTWRQNEGISHSDLTRSTSYYHRKSGAQIDLDLLAHPTGKHNLFTG